jgi:hypothetical protein
MTGGLDRALLFDDQNTRLPEGVRYMFVTILGDKHFTGMQKNIALFAIRRVKHTDLPIQNDENFWTVVDMPSVWVVRPM